MYHLANRIIYILLLVLALVYVSFVGGNVPYMIVGVLFLNIVFSVVYILYVYFTIKIYQDIPARRVTKNEFIPFTLKLNNESFIGYRDVRLTFMTRLSTVTGADELKDVSLEPQEGINCDMELFCKHSGTYFIGVDTIEIMDYFKIFKIKFQMPQKMKVTVKPRIIKPDNISFVMDEAQCHNTSLNGRSDYVLDNSVRKYENGDNKRLIHWKNSAKKGELVIRTQAAEELSQYVVIMDGNLAEKDNDLRIIAADKLREMTIALVNYIYTSGYNVLVKLDDIYEADVSDKRSFNDLYNRITDYGFGAGKNLDGVIGDLNKRINEEVPFIIVTNKGKNIKLDNYRSVFVVDVGAYEDIDELLNSEE